MPHPLAARSQENSRTREQPVSEWHARRALSGVVPLIRVGVHARSTGVWWLGSAWGSSFTGGTSPKDSPNACKAACLEVYWMASINAASPRCPWFLSRAPERQTLGLLFCLLTVRYSLVVLQRTNFVHALCKFCTCYSKRLARLANPPCHEPPSAHQSQGDAFDSNTGRIIKPDECRPNQARLAIDRCPQFTLSCRIEWR